MLSGWKLGHSLHPRSIKRLYFTEIRGTPIVAEGTGREELNQASLYKAPQNGAEDPRRPQGHSTCCAQLGLNPSRRWL